VILYAPESPDPPLPKRWNRMEAFADELTDEEIAALASFPAQRLAQYRRRIHRGSSR
jgi:mono/diheme cytochrome c family protein